jgi:hypothetical protein
MWVMARPGRHTSSVALAETTTVSPRCVISLGRPRCRSTARPRTGGSFCAAEKRTGVLSGTCDTSDGCHLIVALAQALRKTAPIRNVETIGGTVIQ